MNNHVIAVVVSVIVGYVYYEIMESSIPTESNCSFSASPWTDYFAFLWGIIVIIYGYQYDNIVLTCLGSTVIVEHVFQLLHKGGGTAR
jgi:hypothetical protein